MRSRLKRDRGPRDADAGSDERVLALERACQALRLELEDAQRSLTHAGHDLERERGGGRERVEQASRARVEHLLGAMASPLAQLATQAHLAEAEGRQVAVGDVLAVARRLLRSLEREGVEQVGSVGVAVAFDPALHESIGAAAPLEAGSPAVVRFVGFAYKGVTLRKAGVEPAADA
jgi:molecular chaperone GrpE (heat shock protein)